MGVDNTQFRRVTVYLKGAHLDFLDSIIEDLRKHGSTTPSRSDIVRAILDEYADSSDWMTQSLINAVNKYKARSLRDRKSK